MSRFILADEVDIAALSWCQMCGYVVRGNPGSGECDVCDLIARVVALEQAREGDKS